MTIETQVGAEGQPLELPEAEASGPKSRDANNTRLLLLKAARRRFAKDGYRTTTVRDIASDAGVNVALISRYFESKEGLFEACLTKAADELGSRAGSKTVADLSRAIVNQLAGADSAEQSYQLLLLVRTSGDDRAESIRRKTIERFARGMASVGGRDGDEEKSDALILRAQIALAAALGIVLLRSTSGLEPLTSATEAELAEPIADVLSALLG